MKIDGKLAVLPSSDYPEHEIKMMLNKNGKKQLLTLSEEESHFITEIKQILSDEEKILLLNISYDTIEAQIIKQKETYFKLLSEIFNANWYYRETDAKLDFSILLAYDFQTNFSKTQYLRALKVNAISLENCKKMYSYFMNTDSEVYQKRKPIQKVEFI